MRKICEHGAYLEHSPKKETLWLILARWFWSYGFCILLEHLCFVKQAGMVERLTMCMLQVLSWCCRSIAGLWYCKTSDIWECGTMVKGVEGPCRSEYSYHVGRQQIRFKAPTGSSNRWSQSLCWEKWTLFHWDISFGFHKCWNGLPKYSYR